ncbi:unnamed protein product, partial [Cyprideis torosa]
LEAEDIQYLLNMLDIEREPLTEMPSLEDRERLIDCISEVLGLVANETDNMTATDYLWAVVHLKKSWLENRSAPRAGSPSPPSQNDDELPLEEILSDINILCNQTRGKEIHLQGRQDAGLIGPDKTTSVVDSLRGMLRAPGTFRKEFIYDNYMSERCNDLVKELWKKNKRFAIFFDRLKPYFFGHVLYTPVTVWTKSIMVEVERQRMGIFSFLEDNCSSTSDSLVPCEDSEQLLKEAQDRVEVKHLSAAVEFHSPSTEHQDKIPAFVEYILYFTLDEDVEFSGKLWQVAKKRHGRYFPGDKKYITGGFTTFQNLIDQQIMNYTLRELGNKNPKFPVGLSARMIPFPCVYSDQFLEVMNVCFSLLMLLAWMFPGAILLRAIVREKEMKLKESEVMVLMLLLCLYIASLISFCFMLSCFFSKANTAAVAGGLLIIVMGLPQMLLDFWSHEIPPAVILLIVFSVRPVDPMNPSSGLFTMGTFMIILVLNTFFYLTATWYLEGVMPGQYGVPLPWYFPFTRWYWCGGSEGERARKLSATVRAKKEKSRRAQDQEENGLDIPVIQPSLPNMEPGVIVENLRKEWPNGKIAIDDFSCTSILSGLIPPTSGYAIIEGMDFYTEMPQIRQILGICPQYNVLWNDVVFLDEPTSGVDPYSRRSIWTLLSQYKKGRTVIMSTHHMDEAQVLGDRVVIIDRISLNPSGRTVIMSTHHMDEAQVLGDRVVIIADGKLMCAGTFLFLKSIYSDGYYLRLSLKPDNLLTTTNLSGLGAKSTAIPRRKGEQGRRSSAVIKTGDAKEPSEIKAGFDTEDIANGELSDEESVAATGDVATELSGSHDDDAPTETKRVCFAANSSEQRLEAGKPPSTVKVSPSHMKSSKGLRKTKVSASYVEAPVVEDDVDMLMTAGTKIHTEKGLVVIPDVKLLKEEILHRMRPQEQKEMDMEVDVTPVVTFFIQEFYPWAKLHERVAYELTYLLPWVETDKAKQLYGPPRKEVTLIRYLVKQVEAFKELLGIQSYGIADTRMEEVFLKVNAVAEARRMKKPQEVQRTTPTMKVTAFSPRAPPSQPPLMHKSHKVSEFTGGTTWKSRTSESGETKEAGEVKRKGKSAREKERSGEVNEESVGTKTRKETMEERVKSGGGSEEESAEGGKGGEGNQKRRKEVEVEDEASGGTSLHESLEVAKRGGDQLVDLHQLSSFQRPRMRAERYRGVPLYASQFAAINYKRFTNSRQNFRMLFCQRIAPCPIPSALSPVPFPIPSALSPVPFPVHCPQSHSQCNVPCLISSATVPSPIPSALSPVPFPIPSALSPVPFPVHYPLSHPQRICALPLVTLTIFMMALSFLPFLGDPEPRPMLFSEYLLNENFVFFAEFGQGKDWSRLLTQSPYLGPNCVAAKGGAFL